MSQSRKRAMLADLFLCCFRVTGSPYQYTVGKVPAGGTHKVEFGGPGVEKGEVGAKSMHL